MLGLGLSGTGTGWLAADLSLKMPHTVLQGALGRHHDIVLQQQIICTVCMVATLRPALLYMEPARTMHLGPPPLWSLCV